MDRGWTVESKKPTRSLDRSGCGRLKHATGAICHNCIASHSYDHFLRKDKRYVYWYVSKVLCKSCSISSCRTDTCCVQLLELVIQWNLGAAKYSRPSWLLRFRFVCFSAILGWLTVEFGAPSRPPWIETFSGSRTRFKYSCISKLRDRLHGDTHKIHNNRNNKLPPPRLPLPVQPLPASTKPRNPEGVLEEVHRHPKRSPFHPVNCFPHIVTFFYDNNTKLYYRKTNLHRYTVHKQLRAVGYILHIPWRKNISQWQLAPGIIYRYCYRHHHCQSSIIMERWFWLGQDTH